ncbi:outer membrane beta-barrel protein [Helicobacter sp. 23-1045]
MKQTLDNAKSHIGGGNKSLKISHSTTSHKLQKIALSLSLIFCSVNIAFAEESGVFAGFEIGGGETKLEYKVIDIEGNKDGDKEYYSGINYGFVAGYKQFFTPYLGLRYYANLGIHHNLKNFTGTSYRQITLINYGANVDFLGNFVSSESLDFGGFVGLGVGANSLVGEFFKGFKENGWDLTGVDLSLNVGLRANIATNHGLEVLAKVPFLPVKIIDGKIDGVSSYKYTFGQTYSVLARYTISF